MTEHRPPSLQTVIYDVDAHENVATLDGAVPLQPDSVIQLGSPNRDARVLAVTLRVDKAHADLLIDVEVGEPGKWLHPRPIH